MVKFVAKECRSIMKVNTNDITFEDCVMGTSYVKDLNLWNSSEIPLNFLISFEVICDILTFFLKKLEREERKELLNFIIMKLVL